MRPGLVRRFFTSDTVLLKRRLGFPGQVEQLRSRSLHAEGELIRLNAAGDFGVGDVVEADPIQIVDGLQAARLNIARNPARIGQIQNGAALIAKQRARVLRGQKAARPTRRTSGKTTPQRG